MKTGIGSTGEKSIRSLPMPSATATIPKLTP